MSQDNKILRFLDHFWRMNKRRAPKLLLLLWVSQLLWVYSINIGKLKRLISREILMSKLLIWCVSDPFYSNCNKEWGFHIFSNPIWRVSGDYSGSRVYFPVHLGVRTMVGFKLMPRNAWMLEKMPADHLIDWDERAM